MNEIILHTDGKGLWRARSWVGVPIGVRVTDMKLGYLNEDEDFGELRVYFNPEAYPVQDYGLIYTDKKFLRDLRRLLKSHGLNGDDVEYSEQGMQGRSFVSFDIGKKFLKSLRAKTDNLSKWSFMEHAN